MSDRPPTGPRPPLAVVVLISGRGSNLQALIDAIEGGSLHATIRCVICNEPEAEGLARAKRAGIQTRVVAHRDYPRRDAFEQALGACIDDFEPELIVLAGFMRVLGDGIVNRYLGRMINIHPSLLPAFPGLDTHRRAIEAGAKEHGASVHFVTGVLDGGPVIARERVAVHPDDDPSRLAARVLEREHLLLPRVVGWFAASRVELGAEGVLLDGVPVEPG